MEQGQTNHVHRSGGFSYEKTNGIRIDSWIISHVFP